MKASPLGDDDDIIPPSRPPPLLSQSQVDQFCRLGYLTIDLPARVHQEVEEVFRQSSRFFGLPNDTKKALFPTVPRRIGEHGYTQVPGEKEFITLQFRNPFAGVKKTQHQEKAAEVEDSAEPVWRSVAQILHRILVDVSVHLGYIEPSAWDPLLSNALALPSSSAESTPSLMRIFRYEPQNGIAEPHRDLGLLTMCVCRGRGLQVYERAPSTHIPSESMPSADSLESGMARTTSDYASTRWHDAGTVTVLAGDTLRILSGNEVHAGYHRVVATEHGRSSIVFALRPSTNGKIDLASFGGHGEVNAKAFWNRIRQSRVTVNAQRKIREELTRKWKENEAAEDVA